MKVVTPHPEEERSLAELRAEYREEHRKELRRQVSKHPLGWGVVGNPLESRIHFTPEEWGLEMLVHLDQPATWEWHGGDIREANRLEELAQKAMLHEQVTWAEGTEGTVDHDAPPCKPVYLMTDEELCKYVDYAIEVSLDERNQDR